MAVSSIALMLNTISGVKIKIVIYINYSPAGESGVYDPTVEEKNVIFVV